MGTFCYTSELVGQRLGNYTGGGGKFDGHNTVGEALRAINWEQESVRPFEKNLYKEAETVGRGEGCEGGEKIG